MRAGISGRANEQAILACVGAPLSDAARLQANSGEAAIEATHLTQLDATRCEQRRAEQWLGSLQSFLLLAAVGLRCSSHDSAAICCAPLRFGQRLSAAKQKEKGNSSNSKCTHSRTQQQHAHVKRLTVSGRVSNSGGSCIDATAVDSTAGSRSSSSSSSAD